MKHRYPAKCLDLCDILGNYRGLLALVIAIKLRDVVYLHIVSDSVSKTSQQLVGMDTLDFVIDSLTCGDLLVDIRYILP